MIFGSVCSGIEAASVAWLPLGFKCAFTAEVEKFPCSVLNHRYPDVPNHGDITKFKDWPDHAIDILVGGTPCQSFSVAGLRKGMADPRGSLALTFLAIADRYTPRWICWENVPGVLSSDGGRAFGAFLGGLAAIGYGFAYRVLDAQYFGVAQRRRRVFVVGHIGGLWQRAAAVLFERESLRGDSSPSRGAGKRVAATISARTKGGGGLGTDFDLDGGIVNSLTERPNRGGTNSEGQRLVAATIGAATPSRRNGGSYPTEGTLIAHSLRADGFDASEDGTGRGTPLTVIPIQEIGKRQSGTPMNGVGHGAPGDPMFTLQSGAQHGVCAPITSNPYGDHESLESLLIPEVAYALQERDSKGSDSSTKDGHLIPVSSPIAFSSKDHGADAGELAPTLRAAGHDGSHANSGAPPAITSGMAVRRLTPRECERLQGFPDDYTDIRPNGKPTPDGPRYKALGNSMAVPVMNWIGRRIALVDSMIQNTEKKD